MWTLRREGNKNDESPTNARCKKGLGPRGEKLARKYLKRTGLKILAKNYRCVAGEADLIALDKSSDSIVIVEVKTRSSNRYVDPESAVTAEKRRRLRKVGEYYLSTNDTGQMHLRFDVVSIVLQPGLEDDIRHIPDAF